MITFKDICAGLDNLVNGRAGINVVTSVDDLSDAGKSFCWIRLRPARTDLGWGDFIKKIRVDLQFHITPDGFAEISQQDYLEIIDALDVATLNSIPIADRWVVVQDTSSIVFDNILTYSFQLEFSDFWHEIPEQDKVKLMKHLHLKT